MSEGVLWTGGFGQGVLSEVARPSLGEGEFFIALVELLRMSRHY